LLTCIFGCGPKEEKSAPKQLEKIAIAVTPWPASSPIYVAHEKGYFRDEGLDVILHSYISGHLGLDAVLSGKVDLATCGDTPIARAVIDGKPVAVAATISEIEGRSALSRGKTGLSPGPKTSGARRSVWSEARLPISSSIPIWR
jgi:ABC-type nitrate/sulfonate/bicarbonate transport system substrate-binding protein